MPRKWLYLVAAGGVLASVYLYLSVSGERLRPPLEAEAVTEKGDSLTLGAGSGERVGVPRTPLGPAAAQDANRTSEHPPGTLVTEASIRIRVSNSSGRPVSGATVTIRSLQDRVLAGRAESGRNGVANIYLKAEADDAGASELVAEHDMYRSATKRIATQQLMGERLVELTMLRGAIAKGLVLSDATGLAVPDALVRVLENGRILPLRVRTDTEGSFAIDAHSGDRRLVLVRKLGIGTASAWIEFHTRDDEQPTVMRLRGNHRVAGTVVDPQGHPKPNARILGIRPDRLVTHEAAEDVFHIMTRAALDERDEGLDQFTTRANEFGLFDVSGLSSASYVFFERESQSSQEGLGPYSGQEIVLVRYERSYEVIVRVFDETGGLLDRYELEILRKNADGEWKAFAGAVGKPENEGSSRFVIRDPGELLIRATSGDSRGQRIVVVGGLDREVVDLYLARR